MKGNGMTHQLPPQSQWPREGYYYHYKHRDDGDVNNYAYYISGVGKHTETGEYFQVYLPLYREAHVYGLTTTCGVTVFDVRPLHMFFEPAIVNGQKLPRFRRITNLGTLALLAQIHASMYPSPE